MSTQNVEALKSAIYSLSSGDGDLYAALARMTDQEIENLLNEILRK